MTRMLALAALLFVSGPAVSEHRPIQLLGQTYTELAALKADIDLVPDRRLRRQLTQRVDRATGLLHRLESTAVLATGPSHSRAQRPPPAPPPMLTFDEALFMVRAETFDRDKLEAVHRAARNGRFTTHEARAIAAEFSFDSGKADALIALYPAVIDPHRFAMALDVMTFSSNRNRVASTLGL
jgi:hypothetical protein